MADSKSRSSFTPEGWSRITIDIPKDVEDTLHMAANAAGSTLSEFVVQAAVMRAEGAEDEEHTIRLTQEDVEWFSQCIGNLPEPTPELKEAFAKYLARKANPAS